VQTVDSERSPDLHALLTAFHAETGCPVLVNTSFNVRGEPIVCTPHDAYRCFMLTDIDVLVLEDRILLKEEQPPFIDPTPGYDPAMEDMEAPEPALPIAPRKDPPASERLADDLFDTVITPLAKKMQAEGKAFFPMGPDPALKSYFEKPMPHSTGPDMAYPGGGMPAGLVDAIAAHWARSNQPEFAAAATKLKKLAEVMEETEKQSDGKVDIFVYTMF
jgi:Carbamoyltransferase C-terminus